MGQYKVPQNVEAEDKILGPLTFKQFVYALIGVFWALITFAIFRKAIPILIVVGLPPTLLFLLLGFYTRDGQNFEQLLIAMVGYFGNPRRRRWIKEDAIEALHIEPNKVVAEQTQRDPVEVRSQLEKIAGMVDSRGWENHTASGPSLIQPGGAGVGPAPVSPASTPAVLTTEPAASEDILDLQNSPLALNLSALINDAASDVRTEAIEQMKHSPIVKAAPAPKAPEPVPVTAPSASGIVELATNRDDLTVSQLAATATRMVPMAPGQVVEVRSGNASK